MVESSDLRFLLKTARPRFWPPIMMLLLAAYGLSGHRIGLMEISFLLLFTLPANLVVYGLNDLYDWETDRRNHRKSSEDPREREELLKKSMAVSAAAGLALSFLSGKPEVVAGCLLWLAGSYVYSAPPVRLKERPPLDTLVNALYVISPALIGFGLSGGRIPEELLWIAATVPGGHAFTTVPDYEADKAAGQTTFATRFGKKAATAVGLLSGSILLFLAPIESGVFQSYMVFVLLTGVYTSMYLEERKILERSAYTIYLTGNILAAGYVLSVYGVL